MTSLIFSSCLPFSEIHIVNLRLLMWVRVWKPQNFTTIYSSNDYSSAYVMCTRKSREHRWQEDVKNTHARTHILTHKRIVHAVWALDTMKCGSVWHQKLDSNAGTYTPSRKARPYTMAVELQALIVPSIKTNERNKTYWDGGRGGTTTATTVGIPGHIYRRNRNSRVLWRRVSYEC